MTIDSVLWIKPRIENNPCCLQGTDGRNYYWQLFGLYQRPNDEESRGRSQIYDLGVAAASESGKPPPESAARVLCHRCSQLCLEKTREFSKDHSGHGRVHHAIPDSPPNISWVMKLVTTVRASFVSKRRNHGVSCWCTQAASMECGRFPKVLSPVLGPHAKKAMWTHNCFKAFEYGNGGGTMQIKIFSVSLAML